MALAYRVAPLPDPWPAKPTARRGKSPFKSNHGDSMSLLEREIRALQGRDVVMHIGVRADQIRNDGGVYASARVQNPSVIIAFTAGADRLSFPCDRFNWWEDNVRAIALALEALRKVDRYGVQSGRQYQGFKALPGSGTTVSAPLTIERAVENLRELSGVYLLWPVDIDAARNAVRIARSKTHPDRGGKPEDFQRVQDSAALLGERLGVGF